MNILNVFAHSDDLLIWALGSLFKARDEQNAEIAHIILRNKEEDLYPNVDLYEKLRIPTQICQARELNERVLGFNPDKVITHWVFDSNEEHRNVYNLVSQAVLLQRVKNSKGDLYSVSTYNGLGLDNIEFSPNLLVDISEYWNLKEQEVMSLKNEPCQMWLDMARKQGEFYGSRIKVKYAEAFKKVNINGVFNSSDCL